MTPTLRQRVFDTFGFSLPESYCSLSDAGRLRYGSDRDDWNASWQTIATTAPPALMCSPWHMNVEWRAPEDLLAWSPPDYWKPNSFLSFAGNGYGDEWVWDPERATIHGVAVVLCRHDEDEAEVIASSFEDFLFRITVEGFAHISFADRDSMGLDEAGYKRYLALNVMTIEPYVTGEQNRILVECLGNSFTEDPDEERLFLISDRDKQLALDRYMAGTIGVTFEYMQ